MELKFGLPKTPLVSNLKLSQCVDVAGKSQYF